MLVRILWPIGSIPRLRKLTTTAWPTNSTSAITNRANSILTRALRWSATNLKSATLDSSMVAIITARHINITTTTIGVVWVGLTGALVFGWSFISISDICSFLPMYQNQGQWLL